MALALALAEHTPLCEAAGEYEGPTQKGRHARSALPPGCQPPQLAGKATCRKTLWLPAR
eukprot:SAG22_NODE_4562_length_1232_cov_1.649603_3_plen_58_part_01